MTELASKDKHVALVGWRDQMEFVHWIKTASCGINSGATTVTTIICDSPVVSSLGLTTRKGVRDD